jgi:GT2 family glycosyltransferase
MTISAVILSFNAKRDLERCVRSLIEVERFEPGRDQILIVDNGSRDGSKALIAALAAGHPGLVEPICLPANRGTTAPRNLAFAKATGDYVLVIDSDIRFEQPVLPSLIDELDADPTIGIVAPRLMFPDGRRQMSTDRFPTIGRKLERFFRLRALERRTPAPASGSTSATGLPVDYAISAFWLMRRDALDRIGPLDERIFYAPEDVDFCLRAWLCGRRVVYRPDLAAIHDAKERSRSLKSLLFTWRHLLGLAYFFKKHGYAFSADRLYRRIGDHRCAGAFAARARG